MLSTVALTAARSSRVAPAARASNNLAICSRRLESSSACFCSTAAFCSLSAAAVFAWACCTATQTVISAFANPFQHHTVLKYLRLRHGLDVACQSRNRILHVLRDACIHCCTLLHLAAQLG